MTKQEKETIMSARLDVPIGGVNGWGDAGSGDHGNGAMSPPEPLTSYAEVLAKLRVILGCYAAETVEERAQNVMLERHERQNKVIDLTREVAGLKAEAARDSTNATIETLRSILKCYPNDCIEGRATYVMQDRDDVRLELHELIERNEDAASDAARDARDSTNATIETLRMELEGVRAQLQWEQTSKAERQDRIDQLTAEVGSLRTYAASCDDSNSHGVETPDDHTVEYLRGFHAGATLGL